MEEEDGIFDERINYPRGCGSVKRIGLTASADDEANKMRFIANMVGNYDNYERHCVEKPNPMFDCVRPLPKAN